MPNPTDRARPRRRGFTLIELLVVIVVIGVLVSIVIAVGGGVQRSARVRLTRDTIRVVDTVTESYLLQLDELPPALVAGPAASGAIGGTANDRSAIYPIADGTGLLAAGAVEGSPINSIGYFVLAAAEIGLDSELAQLSGDVYRRFDPDGEVDGGSGEVEQPFINTVFDAWGNPLRFVHPRFDGLIGEIDAASGEVARTVGSPGQGIAVVEAQIGGMPDPSLFHLRNSAIPDGFDATSVTDLSVLPMRQIRRNVLTDADRAMWGGPGPAIGDSDGGVCVNGRPYVYSAGPDGDPSTFDREETEDVQEGDNVYTAVPRFIEN